MNEESPRIYLDTNIILDVVEERRKASTLLLEKVKRSKWYCCTSMFALCEAIDIEQQFTHIENMLKKKYSPDQILRKRRQKRISQEERENAIEKVESFFDKYPVEIFAIEKDAWEKALQTMRDLNVSACDSIQIVTALEAKCTVLITNDKELRKYAKKLLSCLKSTEALDKLHRTATTQC